MGDVQPLKTQSRSTGFIKWDAAYWGIPSGLLLQYGFIELALGMRQFPLLARALLRTPASLTHIDTTWFCWWAPVSFHFFGDDFFPRFDGLQDQITWADHPLEARNLNPWRFQVLLQLPKVDFPTRPVYCLILATNQNGPSYSVHNLHWPWGSPFCLILDSPGNQCFAYSTMKVLVIFDPIGSPGHDGHARLHAHALWLQDAETQSPSQRSSWRVLGSWMFSIPW